MINVDGQIWISTRRAGLVLRCQHIAFALLIAVSLQGRADEGSLVAAASSLRSLWPELLESYTSQTGQAAPRVSFGSSGLLATQIVNGAPFDLFLSADLASIERLPSDQLASKPQVFALGDLHLVAPENSPMSSSLSLETLATIIRKPMDGPLLRIAIPNPAHAPYGQAARDTLIHIGIWPLPADQLLAAENAAQTLQFVRSGAVDAAIVPLALVSAHPEGLVSVPLPANSYTPISHTLAVFSHADRPARQFAKWLTGTDATSVFASAGLRSVEKPLGR